MMLVGCAQLNDKSKNDDVVPCIVFGPRSGSHAMLPSRRGFPCEAAADGSRAALDLGQTLSRVALSTNGR